MPAVTLRLPVNGMIDGRTSEDVRLRESAPVLAHGFHLPHSVEMLDGTLLPGDTDRRGTEEALLGAEKFWGLHVIEVAPRSPWLSAHLAARSGDYAALDGPLHTDDGEDDASAGWWQAMHALGLKPEAVAADDLSSERACTCDVAVSFGALSRAENPVALLGRMAALSNDTIIVIEPSETDDGDGLLEARMTMVPETGEPDGPCWIFTAALLQRLLARVGFESRLVTGHAAAGGSETGSSVTVVARRPIRRHPAPRQELPRAVAATPQVSPDHEAAQDLPLPPPADRRASGGTADVEVFVTVGRNVFEQMVQALARDGVAAGHAGRVLDFGCGFSRVLRWWRMFPAVEVHGTDIDVAAIMWNRERLGYGAFAFNTLDPRLDYPSDGFDLVHAIDVMTHQPEHLQIPWFKELLRVLRPGGHLYFTSRGRSCRSLLPADLQAVFDDHRLVSGGADQAGTEHCVAFHPPQWVVNTLIPATDAEIVELVEWREGSPGQDLWLLRKSDTLGRRERSGNAA